MGEAPSGESLMSLASKRHPTFHGDLWYLKSWERVQAKRKLSSTCNIINYDIFEG
jgi:hypothetical protein